MKKFAILLGALLLPLMLSGQPEIICEGIYPQHLQDLCRGEDGSLYWCFTNRLIKTDAQGNFLRGIAVDGHHGGLTVRDGLLYVSTCYINDWSRGADYSEIFVYNPEDLSFVKKIPFPDATGIDGIEATPDGFAVAPFELLNDPSPLKWVYEYTPDFQLIAKHAVPVGQTYAGVQSLKATRDGYLLGCYGSRFALVDKQFKLLKLYDFDAGCGFLTEDDGTIMAARLFNEIKGKQYRAKLTPFQLSELPEVPPPAETSAE